MLLLTRVHHVGVLFDFIMFALLLVAVVLCWVDRSFGSWVLLGVFCLFLVTPRWARMGVLSLACWEYAVSPYEVCEPFQILRSFRSCYLVVP